MKPNPERVDFAVQQARKQFAKFCRSIRAAVRSAENLMELDEFAEAMKTLTQVQDHCKQAIYTADFCGLLLGHTEENRNYDDPRKGTGIVGPGPGAESSQGL